MQCILYCPWLGATSSLVTFAAQPAQTELRLCVADVNYLLQEPCGWSNYICVAFASHDQLLRQPPGAAVAAPACAQSLAHHCPLQGRQ